MNKEKISIIIPVYNTEKYIKKSIESVINQSYKNLEIIVVNDGSIDESEKIIKSFLNLDERIKYFYQENKGLGLARNKGLENVTGDFILFLDSDDFLEENCIEKIYSQMKKNIDIIIFNMKKIDENGQVIINKFLNLKNEVIDLTKISIKTYFMKYFFNYKHGHEACNKLYRTNLIKRSKILFDDNNKICSEDLLFNLKIILHTSSIQTINESYYNYLQRNNSLMNSGYRENLIVKFNNLIEEYNEYIEKNRNNDLSLEVSAIHFTLINASLANEKFRKGNLINGYYDVLKKANTDLYRKNVRNIIKENEIKKMFQEYGFSNTSIVIIKIFLFISLINLKFASIIWFFYISYSQKYKGKS